MRAALAVWLITLSLADFVENSWLLDQLDHLNDTLTVRSYSCGLAIGLDTQQPCFAECSKLCGIDSSHEIFWSYRLASKSESTVDKGGQCLALNPMCVVPTGSHTRFIPSKELSEESGYIVRVDSAGKPLWYPYGVKMAQVESDKTATVTTYHRTLLLDQDDLRQLIDPLRLSLMSFKLNNRIVADKKGRYIEFVRVGREVSPNIESEYGADDMDLWHKKWYPNIGGNEESDIPFVAYDGSLFINNKVKFREPVASSAGTGEEPMEDLEARLYAKGDMYSLQTIHPYIQQWFLRYGEYSTLPRLALSLARAYPAYTASGSVSPGNRENEVGINVNKPGFNSDEESDQKSGVESFTTLAFAGLSVNPQCADRNSCASCAVSGICSWCDMRGARIKKDVHVWGGWFKASKSRLEDGSVCGLPPLVCVMMGGEPSTNRCPVAWKKEWDTYHD